MAPETLIELLNAERDYHSKHPKEVNIKFIYTIGASITGIIVTILFGTNKEHQLINPELLRLPVLFFSIGFLCLFWGLGEHYSFHFQQRVRVEKAINDVILQLPHFNYDTFIKANNLIHLRYMGNIYLKKPTLLFTNEPDTRSFWRFHDRKIESGVLLILFAYGCLIYYFLTSHLA